MRHLPHPEAAGRPVPRPRLVLAAALAATLAGLTVGASAGPPKTLDGKRVTQLTIVASGGTQDHDSDNATQQLTTPDRADCAPPRCARLPFVYKPAKGVTGDLMFTITWGTTLSDYDLYVAEIAKDGSSSTLTGSDGTKYQCGGTGGTSEKVFVPRSALKPGRTYALVADFFRSVSDTVHGTVAMGPSTVKKVVPPQYDGKFPGTLYPINCTQ